MVTGFAGRVGLILFFDLEEVRWAIENLLTVGLKVDGAVFSRPGNSYGVEADMFSVTFSGFANPIGLWVAVLCLRGVDLFRIHRFSPGVGVECMTTSAIADVRRVRLRTVSPGFVRDRLGFLDE